MFRADIFRIMNVYRKNKLIFVYERNCRVAALIVNEVDE